MDKKDAFAYIQGVIRRRKSKRPSMLAATIGNNRVATASVVETLDANNQTNNNYSVEVGTHPDTDRNFEVSSVVPTNYDGTKELATFLFVATVL